MMAMKKNMKNAKIAEQAKKKKAGGNESNALADKMKAAEKLSSRAGVAENRTGSGFPIVGIGASAGGLAAFEAFFSGMPATKEPGMAFVLVQHLAPDHKSILTDLIRKYTRMQVFEVEDGMPVRVNCVYIIPPNRSLALLNGALQLIEPAAPRGQRTPIDFFFRSLAHDQHERAICVVLSGTGSDGTLGLRAVKGEGGMAMAQVPESTEFDGMPSSAIATGLVDYVLPPAAMPARIIAFVAHAFGKLPRNSMSPPHAENELKKIFILLRDRTGNDFSLYKPNTINRRIERRMAVQQIATLEGYVKYLQQTPAEVDVLFNDMLINVTAFFRDAEAFQALEEQVIPKLFERKPPGSVIRAWTPGCSSGEEGYSLAMLLQERMEALKQNFKAQVFATDIDIRAIAAARAGIYPASSVADIPPERLARFFTAEHGSSAYRIHKNIRDMLVFSEQNVIKDPPFSKLDLIICRNLLIYMSGELQKRIIPLYHYALNPGGYLFLGTSESVGDFGDLFDALNRKLKLYQRRDSVPGGQHMTRGHLLPAMINKAGELPRASQPPPATYAPPPAQPLRELIEKVLLQQVAPAGALVDGQGDILYLRGRTGLYLEPAPGDAAVSNILKMAREGLRNELNKALHKAVKTGEIVRSPGLSVRTNGGFSAVNLAVLPMPVVPPALPLYLVMLEEATPAQGGGGTAREAGASAGPAAVSGHEAVDSDAGIAALKHELRAKEEYLHAANEELETANEELKSAIEEMQSVNEELQSANEEMETAKEELQSVNEELATVNAELQTKVTDLSQANNDMNNLLAGTGIATIFVDLQLRILRFTSEATRIINLIASDVQRPVGHIVSNLVGYDSLVADAKAVLDTLVPKEVQVQTADGRWYTMRIRPYRTLDNVIEGAVITFVDISELRKARESLRQADRLLRLAVVVRDANDAITVQDLDGRILAWNPGAERMYGWSEAEALNMNIRDLIPENERQASLAVIKRLGQAEIIEPFRMKRLAKSGRIVEVSLTASALVDPTGKAYAVSTTEREIGVKDPKKGNDKKKVSRN